MLCLQYMHNLFGFAEAICVQIIKIIYVHLVYVLGS